MSLDDFIITHFTKGPGVDTLSTKIYTEVKKGIKPEMYALSTLIFMTVLVLLILVNKAPKPKGKTIECTLCEHFIVMNNTPGFSRDTPDSQLSS